VPLTRPNKSPAAACAHLEYEEVGPKERVGGPQRALLIVRRHVELGRLGRGCDHGAALRRRQALPLLLLPLWLLSRWFAIAAALVLILLILLLAVGILAIAPLTLVVVRFLVPAAAAAAVEVVLVIQVVLGVHLHHQH